MAGAGAIIGGVGSIAGGVASGKGAKKAAKIQAQSAREQMAALQNMYNTNVSMFTPEMNSGNAAMDQINRLLGLTPLTNDNFNAGYHQGQVPTATSPQAVSSLNAKQLAHKYGGDAADYLDNNPATGGYQTIPANENTGIVPPSTTSAVPVQSALDIIRSTPGYQFQVDEAMKAINSNANAAGLSNSGATYKALLQRGQSLGDLYFNNYLSQLTDVANRGSGAKSSISGVSQNYTNSLNQVSQNNANAQAANAFYQGQNLSNMINSAANMFGSIYGGAKK